MKFFVTSKLSENMHETPEGYLVCVGVAIARTGEMEYGVGETPIEAGEDGRVLITRDEKEVFRPETLASFQGKAVTILHPSQPVSPENWSSLAKGVIQNVRRGEGNEATDIIADLLITDAVAVNLVKNGLREVSCGYDADYIQTGKGRGIQKNIIGNHLALVEEGRAGSQYAINDHKGKVHMKKIGETIKAIFGKAQEDALKAVETTDEKAPPEEKKKDEPAKDAEAPMGYDALFKAVKDIGEMVSKMAPKDTETKPTMNEPAEMKDDEVAPSLEDRLAKLEMAVSKLLESQTGDAEESEEEETDDAESCDDEESEEKGEMVGDTASRIEILAPGMDPQMKDVKRKALIAAYATTDGKKAVELFTAGKKPDLKSDETVELLFIGVSEALKESRGTEFAKTKTHDFKTTDQPKGAMTAERLNEMNAKHYSKAS